MGGKVYFFIEYSSVVFSCSAASYVYNNVIGHFCAIVVWSCCYLVTMAITVT